MFYFIVKMIDNNVINAMGEKPKQFKKTSKTIKRWTSNHQRRFRIKKNTRIHSIDPDG